jgi:hypothetical protein
MVRALQIGAGVTPRWANELQFVESPLFLTIRHDSGATTRIPWVHVDGVLEWTE